jgi:hypothetical protein
VDAAARDDLMASNGSHGHMLALSQPFRPFLRFPLEVNSTIQEFTGSYSVDKRMRSELLSKYSQCIVVAVPNRGGLVSVKLADSVGVV